MPSSAINKTARRVANAIQLLAIVLYCSCLVHGQQQQQQQQQAQQQQHLKYQQLQYQMQQQYEYQQQQHYQQQFQQQQQQKHKEQQHNKGEKQQQLTPTATLPQQQHEESFDLLSTQPSQLLQTGVSLIVDDGKGSSGDGSGNGSGSGSGTNTRRRNPQLGATRKRKRRPQLPLATMGATEEENGDPAYWRGHVEDDAEALRRRKPQPGTLTIRENPEKQDPNSHGSSPSKAYRRPYGQAKKDSLAGQEGAAAPTSKTAVDLKNILKNSGGLSLSEILQQKNLSLDDLLKGKQNALLALQTTAVAPAQVTTYGAEEPLHKSVGQQNKQIVRRLPAGYATTSTNGHEEERDKNKAKYPPALQRLKLFGSSSREASSSSRRPVSSTTAPPSPSTTSSSTTTRIPLYKKRQHLRSTLKPPGLFKTVGSSTTTSTTPPPPMTTQQQEVETSTTSTTSTPVGYGQEQSEEVPDKSEEEPSDLESHENHEEVEEQPTDSSEAESGEGHHQTEAAPEELASSPEPASSYPGGNPRYRLRNSSIKETTKRLKDNFIVESGEDVVDGSASSTSEAPPPSTSAAPPPPSRSSEELIYNDDDLENFFDEVESNTHHTRVRKPEESPEALPSPSFEPPAATITTTITGDQKKKLPPAQMNLVDDVDDRTDLLELIEDRRSGNRLFKVLEQRNMTLEELIEHRKRGSSQLHLSTIVSGDEHSRLYPGQKVILQDNMDIVTAFENFPHFNLMDLKSVKPDEIKTDSQGSSYFTSIIDIEPNDEVKPGFGGGVGVSGRGAPPPGSRGPTYAQTAVSSSSSPGGTITINQRGEKSLGFFPSWKTLALASLATATATEDRNPYFLPPPRLLLDGGGGGSISQEQSSNPESDLAGGEPTSIDIDLGVSPYGSSGNSSMDNARLPFNNDVIEEIENEVARAHDLLDLELSGPGFHRSPAAAAATSAVSQQHLSSLYSSMPSGIRSALVASTAIVVTALATFLVVFVVCRWKQQRRRKSSYLRTYNAMKSKLPQMQPRHPSAPASGAASSSASMRHHMEELGMGMGVGVGIGTGKKRSENPGITSISTSVACCTPVHQLQRQSSLLFSRDGSATLSTATSLTTSGSGAGSVTTPTTPAANAPGHESAMSGRGLAISLRSAHQKLNTMDPNSPEVQEYLFDTLRKSFDN
ncbi:hypothetical protein KR074_003658 [Drosophila pseudoananassae]|nr:hypothetical protein KR074_003658 [Drosophila pseudoananassae]